MMFTMDTQRGKKEYTMLGIPKKKKNLNSVVAWKNASISNKEELTRTNRIATVSIEAHSD